MQKGQESRTNIGFEKVSNGVLVAAILGKQPNEVLKFFDTFPIGSLPELSANQMEQELGVTEQEFELLQLSIELGRRVSEQRFVAKLPCVALDSSSAAIEYCREKFARLVVEGRQEEFHILTLTSKHDIIQSHRITVGTLNASLVHPREVFRPAILDSAAAIIAVHNHPSGDPTPSNEDHSVTDRLTKAGQEIGIDLLDHLILAQHGCVSLRQSRPRPR